METRNEIFSGQFTGDDEWIDCEINHLSLGWIPCHINPEEYPDEYAVAATRAAPYVAPAITEAEVRQEAARRLELVASMYSRQERETWSQQVKDVEAYRADNTAITPLMDAIAAGRGITRDDMATRIEMNASAFSMASGAILGAQAAILALDPIPSDYADDARWL